MRLYAAIAAAVGWFALALQLYLIIAVNAASGVPAFETIVRYFSFFTILINCLAAYTVTAAAWDPRPERFFSRPAVQTAIASYISIVGIVCVTILSSLWAPQGAQWLADNLLHHAMPVIYVLFWLFFVRKGTLTWRNTIPWLIFPLIYVIFVLSRGMPSGFYPYPFLDVSKLGWAGVLKNCVAMFAFFVVMGLIYVGLDRALARLFPGRR